ncbi:MAG: hypothetical protein R3F43_25685 [bacterium]
MILGLVALVALAAPAGLADEAVQARVVKAIKESERAGFERHRLPAHLELYTRDATFTRARREQPGPHDVVLTRAQAEALLALELAAPPARTDRLFFEEPVFDLEADPPTVSFRISRSFFGGRDLIAARYALREEGGRWRVAAVRTWPIEEEVADSKLAFDDAFWEKADAAADRQSTADVSEKVEEYRFARRWADAWRLLVLITARPDATAREWTERATYALRIGDVPDARASIARAQALDPLADVPPLLRKAVKKPR